MPGCRTQQSVAGARHSLQSGSVAPDLQNQHCYTVAMQGDSSIPEISTLQKRNKESSPGYFSAQSPTHVSTTWKKWAPDTFLHAGETGQLMLVLIFLTSYSFSYHHPLNDDFILPIFVSFRVAQLLEGHSLMIRFMKQHIPREREVSARLGKQEMNPAWCNGPHL